MFDIALAPEFNAEITNQDTVDYYTIEVADEIGGTASEDVHSACRQNMIR